MTETGTTRCGFVALIGAPNAGNSTLMNALVGAKVTIVSRKVQTTRALVRGIANRAGSEHDQLRVSLEGVARVVGLTLHLPEFALTLLCAPAPQLAADAAALCHRRGRGDGAGGRGGDDAAAAALAAATGHHIDRRG